VRIRVAFAALLLATTPVAAQRGPELEIVLPAPDALATEGPAVRAVNVLSDSKVRELLDSGFPARLHFRLELWSAGGMFNSLRGTTEWDVVVRYDALNKRYQLVRLNGGAVVASARFAEFATALAEAERPYRAPLPARRQLDRQYYNAVLELETMSRDDLDELERWLRGELKPAVRGQRNPGTAIGRGLRDLFVKLLGAEQWTLEKRSPTFRVR
jgi:uncharacterized protein DUF4390